MTLRVLQNYADTLEKAAGANPDAATLKDCVRVCAVAAGVRDRIRSHVFEAKESKLSLGDNQPELAPLTVHLSRRLFTLEGKAEHLEEAFRAAEMATARVFLESLGKSRALNIGGVPAALASQEARLLESLRQTDQQLDLQLARPLGQRDDSFLESLSRHRQESEAALQMLTADLDRQYPLYASFRHPKPCSLAKRVPVLPSQRMKWL